MKLIHTADFHLDALSDANCSREQARERKRELLNNFVRLSDYAEKEGVSGIIIAGDLFDREQVTIVAKQLVLSTISAHPGITYFLLFGNHDGGRVFSGEKLPDNLKRFGGDFTSYEFGPVTVTGAEIEEAGADLYEKLTLPREKTNIVVLHGQVRDEYGVNDGKNVFLRSLRNKNVDYLALGHIHRFVTGELPDRGTWAYAGCPEGRGFDETGEKGFALLHIDETSGALDTEFVPFGLRKIFRVEQAVTGISGTGELIEKVRENLAEREITEKDSVLLVLTGETDAETGPDTAQLELAFSSLFYGFRVKDETRKIVDYGRYAEDLSLKGEFIRLVQKTETLREEEKADVIRLGVRALLGEELS